MEGQVPLRFPSSANSSTNPTWCPEFPNIASGRAFPQIYFSSLLGVFFGAFVGAGKKKGKNNC